MIHLLSLETSCDETSAAVVRLKENKIKILANITNSQIGAHQKYGGVVPEVAARRHAENIIPCLEQALKQAFLTKADSLIYKHRRPIQSLISEKIDAIAITYGPGLFVALSVGLETAKTLAYIWQKPLIPVNHIEAHIYSVLGNKQYQESNHKKREEKQNKIFYPALSLVVSGGHTELILIKKIGHYKYLGRTLDDAVGEAFDKTAKILGLPYPGGPAVAALAQKGDSQIFKMPRPMLQSGDYNFSFSGLKTHILYLWQSLKPDQRKKNIANICASFERAATDVLIAKTISAANYYQVKTVLAVGGVSANQKLRQNLALTLQEIMPRTNLLLPDLSLCGDNAGMIGIAGALRFQPGKTGGDIFKISAQPKLKLE